MYCKKKLTLLCAVLFTFCSFLSAQTLSYDVSTLFSGSGNCAACHIAGDGVFTTLAGVDISPTTLWRSTMMANAARDPLWQAKVSAEVAAHPALQEVIEDKCTTCHSPMGRTETHFLGSEYFTFQQAMTDGLSLDGVSCSLCHQIQNNNFASETSFSGGYTILNQHEIYGPYDAPTTMPMFNQTGYTPVYAEHMHDSELCATCHTLFTPYVDNDGNVAGYFAEQTPYLEWKNSSYPAEEKECQTCHMPANPQGMIIATTPPWLTTLRAPIWQHEFVGGNVFMNSLLNQNRAAIGVPANQAEMDSTFNRMREMLSTQTVDLSANASIMQDTLKIDVLVQNLCGHKFPTGFPSRRAWLHVQVMNDKNEIVFESGKWNDQGEIIGSGVGIQPHHDMISMQDQVQIYQPVMQDVDGKMTHTLLRGAAYLKDNRIPPKGFTSAADDYATVSITGQAEYDVNFNKNATGIQGTGSDHVFYHIDVAAKGSSFTVYIDMLYQSVSPDFATDLFAYHTDKTTQFSQYYAQTDPSPFVVDAINFSLINSRVEDAEEMLPTEIGNFENYPNPFNPGTRICYSLASSAFVNLKIYDLLGNEIQTLVNDYQSAGHHEINFNAVHLPSGMYLCTIKTVKDSQTRKILKLQ